MLRYAFYFYAIVSTLFLLLFAINSNFNIESVIFRNQRVERLNQDRNVAENPSKSGKGFIAKPAKLGYSGKNDNLKPHKKNTSGTGGNNQKVSSKGNRILLRSIRPKSPTEVPTKTEAILDVLKSLSGGKKEKEGSIQMKPTKYQTEQLTSRKTEDNQIIVKNLSVMNQSDKKPEASIEIIHQGDKIPESSSKIKPTVYETKQPKKFIRDSRKPHYMKIVGAWGRLGNHIFFYAGLRGIGTKINYTPMIPANDPIFKLFNINRNYSVPITRMTNVVKRGSLGIGIYTPDLMEPPTQDVNLTISGYLQTYKYFQHIDAELRKELTIKDEVKKRVAQIFQDLKIVSRLKIGVHARRGDFVHRPGTAIPDKEYFLKAMKMMREMYKNPAFVVCSEDIEWVKTNLAGDDVYFVHENVEVDFAALASCKHSVISSGTFGWWVAYLVNGTTIYYKGFPKPPLLQTFKLDDYYPPRWIGLR